MDGHGKAITISPRTALKGDTKEQYRDHGLGWAQYYARIDEVRAFLPEVWLLRPDNLEASLYHWKSGPLNRLASILSERFLDSSWSFEYDGKQREMPETLEKAHRFLKASVQNFPFWKDELKPRFENALSKYLGRAAVVGLVPDVQSLREWLTQQLAASFSAEAGAPMTPLRVMGSGWQALARLAALEVLQQLQSGTQTPVLILFEEPETYLHPHLRRKLRDILEGLASGGWIVVVSTHAPEFVTFRKPQQIVRLWPGSPTPLHGRLLTSGLSQEIKFQEKLDERGNHEFLFAHRVILCEGKDDFSAVCTYLEKAQIDVDGFGVTILDLGGVDNMPSYARIARDLKIPWCAITDEDFLADGKRNPKTEAVRKELAQVVTASDISPTWPTSLESVLGCTTGKATPQWQQIYFARKTMDQINLDYPQFVQVAESIARWIMHR